MITMQDIADKAGVSKGTVSYVLGGKEKRARIKPETCLRVQAIADEMGYYRNELARSIATGRNEVIAFVSYDTGWGYVGRITAGIMAEVTRRKFALKVYNLLQDTTMDITRQLVEQRVAGVIFHASADAEYCFIREEMRKHNIPYATVNLSNSGMGFGITSDDFQGAEDAVKYLVSLGHRRLAYISLEGETEFAVNRCRGFVAGMRKYLAAEKEPRIEYASSSGQDGNEVLCDRIMAEAKNRRPTAIFCFSDYIAANVMQAAARAGVKIPEELSVMGFADVDIARFTAPPLTTMAQPFVEMGSDVAQRLFEDIYRVPREDERINCRLPVTLVIRKSTAAPPEN